MRKYLLITGILIFIVTLVLVFKPVPIPLEKDCLIATGTVVNIYEDGVKDIVFKLENNNTTYYINRGLERGLALNKLQAELLNKEVIIKYPRYWTPLNPANTVRHVSKIELDGKSIFSELR